MKIVLLCGEQFNQVALANKVASRFNLNGIVIEKKVLKKATRFPWLQLVEKLLDRTIFVTIRNAWTNVQDTYKKEFPAFPDTQKVIVSNINSDTTIEFINQLQPDILLVSGTKILKAKTLQLPIPMGIINLHTGLSPYIKGGPNCTNWCLAEGKFHLIGNTVMWIDAGVDSGDIITTECTMLEGTESLFELHMKVMNHAHELCLKALKTIQDDYINCPRVKQQSIGTGTTFKTKQWNYKTKLQLLKNKQKLPAYFKSALYKNEIRKIKTIPL